MLFKKDLMINEIHVPEELKNYCLAILCRNYTAHHSTPVFIFKDKEYFEKTIHMIISGIFDLYSRYSEIIDKE